MSLPPLRGSARPKPGACSEQCPGVLPPSPARASPPLGTSRGAASCSGFWRLKLPPWPRPGTPVFDAPALGAPKGGRSQGFETEALAPKISFLVLMPAACRPLMLEWEARMSPFPGFCKGLFLFFAFLFAKAKKNLVILHCLHVSRSWTSFRAKVEGSPTPVFPSSPPQGGDLHFI